MQGHVFPDIFPVLTAEFSRATRQYLTHRMPRIAFSYLSPSFVLPAHHVRPRYFSQSYRSLSEATQRAPA